MVNSHAGCQTILICILDSVVALANVLLLGLCMFAVFAIMGLNMFLGPRGFIVGSALRRYIIVILSLYYRRISTASLYS